MKAKELKEIALTTVWQKNPISGEIMGIKSQGYVFNHNNFQAFCEALCKEQREICSKININHDYDSGLEVEIAILNAPAPEL